MKEPTKPARGKTVVEKKRSASRTRAAAANKATPKRPAPKKSTPTGEARPSTAEAAKPEPLEVIDLFEQPQRAQADQILAIPTLVRELPAPIKKIIGDLSNKDRVLLGLDIRDGD